MYLFVKNIFIKNHDHTVIVNYFDHDHSVVEI